MLLLSSCHCGAVSFSVKSLHPYPYMRSQKAQSVVRQLGAAVMLSISSRGNTTLKVEGEENVTNYRAKIQNSEDPQPHQSQGERR